MFKKIEIVKSENQTDYDHTNEELPYPFIFKTLGFSFWRRDIVDEKGNEFFWSVGIGRKGYQ